MAQIALAAGMAMLCAAPATAQRKFPPDIMAPAGTQPPAAPKPERALPQSDQAPKSTPQPQRTTTAPAQQHPATANAPTPTAPTATPKSHKLVGRKRMTKPSPIPQPEPTPTPAPPPPPPTPQQMPPQPPEVQYRDGRLTVSAKNSTLSDVLNAIRAQSGATMTLPPTGLGDRLFVQVGPAPPRDVLSKLLAGTNFDYVLVGSPQDPDSLKQVIVTPRSPQGAVAQNSPNPGGYSPQSRLPGMGAPEEDERRAAPPPQQTMPGGFGAAPVGPGPFQPNPAMAPPGVANPTPMPATPGPTGIAPVQPPQMPPNQPPQMPPQGTQTGQPPQPKTPEQLLQELKQMQQQQQQQPQQQKPPK